MTLGLGAGFLASFVVDAVLYDRIGTPERQFVDAVAFVAVAAPVWLVVQPRRVRDAHDVLAWLNGWETDRWSREIGRRLGWLPRARPEILDGMPDTLGLRPLRVELLAARGELAEARERVDQLPTDTPWQRFERAALEEWVAWCSDRPSLLGPMRAAARELDGEDRALVARVMVAAAEARRAATGGGDAATPLAAMRPELGNRLGRYAFGHRTGIVVFVLLIGAVAAGSVAVASAVLR